MLWYEILLTVLFIAALLGLGVWFLIMNIQELRKTIKAKETEKEKSLKCRMNLGARTDLYDALNWLDEIPSSLPRTEAERSIRAAIATLEELNND